MPKPFVNLDDVPREHVQHGARFDARVARVGTFLGARQLGYSREGDCICARAGEAPHQLENDSSAPLRFLAVSSIAETDVVEYPDSRKVGYDIGSGVAEPPRSQYLRDGRVVDYWEGEE